MKLPVSIIILSYNEEDVIGDAIESAVDVATEVIVIDSGSADRTVEIAKLKKVRVLTHTFRDFSDQRNFAVTQAAQDWILFLDSDERLTNEFKRELKQVIEQYDPEGSIGGYFIQRKTFFFGKDWGNGDRVQRLFYKRRFVKWYGVVHESAEIKGEWAQMQEPILHYTHRNLSQMIEKTNKWSEYEAKLRFDSGHPRMNVWRFGRVMVTGFIKSYFSEGGYKNGTAGIVESIYQAFSMFVTYAKLWEMQRKG